MGQSSESVVRIMSAEEIVARGSHEPEALLWPDRRTWFLERAMRMQQLARRQGPTAGYLLLMAKLARAQHERLDAFADVALPDAQCLQKARVAGSAPLDVHVWQRDPAWHQGLFEFLDELIADADLPVDIKQHIQRLKVMPTVQIEQQADLILAGSSAGLDVALAPFIGAALQMYWVHLVCACDGVRAPELYEAIDVNDSATCPCCGSMPVASVTRASARVAGQRYLSCALCGVQWNMVRIKCARCANEDAITYLSLDAVQADDGGRAAHAAIQAESCDHCHAYLKIMHTERDPALDPTADDIASLALDVLVAETGKFRYGMNLLLQFSDSNTSV